MPNINGDGLGPDDNEAILAAVRETTILPDVNDTETSRFVYSVKKGVEDRAFRDWACETGSNDNCAVFIYVPRPRIPSPKFQEKNFELKQVRDLPIRDQKIFGRVFFLGLDASNGFYIDLPVCADELDGWLEEVGLDAAPIATAYKDTLRTVSYTHLTLPTILLV